MSIPKSSFKPDLFWILKSHAKIKIQLVYVEMLQRYDFLDKIADLRPKIRDYSYKLTRVREGIHEPSNYSGYCW
jgi:hypothetical protein